MSQANKSSTFDTLLGQFLRLRALGDHSVFFVLSSIAFRLGNLAFCSLHMESPETRAIHPPPPGIGNDPTQDSYPAHGIPRIDTHVKTLHFLTNSCCPYRSLELWFIVSAQPQDCVDQGAVMSRVISLGAGGDPPDKIGPVSPKTWLQEPCRATATFWLTSGEPLTEDTTSVLSKPGQEWRGLLASLGP